MLILRPYKSCDAARIASWCRTEEEYLKWSGGRFGSFPAAPQTIDEKYRLANGDCTEPDNFYPLTAVEETGPVGHFIIRYTGGDCRQLRFGWVIVDGSKRGMGLGKRMLRLGLQYAFEILGAQQVTIGVFDNNLPARHCYLAVGFRDVGEQYEQIGETRWRILEMAISAEEYRKLPR